MPSIPILTTPQRSQRRPARAPRAVNRPRKSQQAQHLKTLSHAGPDEDAAHETEDIDAKAHGMEARRWSGKHAPAGDEGYPCASKACRVKLCCSHGPKTQRGQNVRRYRVGPPRVPYRRGDRAGRVPGGAAARGSPYATPTRRRRRARTRWSATRPMMTSAWMTLIKSMETPVRTCISPAPLRSPPQEGGGKNTEGT